MPWSGAGGVGVANHAWGPGAKGEGRQKDDSTRNSQGVSHPITNQSRPCLAWAAARRLRALLLVLACPLGEPSALLPRPSSVHAQRLHSGQAGPAAQRPMEAAPPPHTTIRGQHPPDPASARRASGTTERPAGRVCVRGLLVGLRAAEV